MKYQKHLSSFKLHKKTRLVNFIVQLWLNLMLLLGLFYCKHWNSFFRQFPIEKFLEVNLGKFQDIWVFLKAFKTFLSLFSSFFFYFWSSVIISVRAKGAGGAAAPPEKFFSGKTAKIYVISKRFSGKMFGQTGFLPPPKSGNFLGKKKIFFGQTGVAPPSSVVPVRLWVW